MATVAFCTPTLEKPLPEFTASLLASCASLPAGNQYLVEVEVGCPYISAARSALLKRALAKGADIVVFLDHDVSWSPDALKELIEAPGDVVAGTYRFKKAEVEYMGRVCCGPRGTPLVRVDGAIMAELVPAGFLKITKAAVDRISDAYPELICGEGENVSLDLFNHGAHKGVWWGEDYAFCRRWREIGGEIWLLPDLDIGHHSQNGVSYPGNFHEFLRRQPGGDKEEKR